MRQTAPAMLSPAQPKPSAFLHSLDPKRTCRTVLLDHLVGAAMANAAEAAEAHSRESAADSSRRHAVQGR